MKEYNGIPMDPHMFDSVIGKGRPVQNMPYTWRDVALYAVGVGAHLADKQYVYERCKEGFKALPTFAMIPYINNLTMQTITPIPEGTNEFVRDYMESLLGYMPNGLHMAMDITMHNVIDPYCGKFVVKDRLNNVLDRGEGKGTVADCAMEVYDIAGRPIATLHSYHFNNAFGGFGGEPFKSLKLPYPDREPDYETKEFLPENLACIYRLCGDTYKVHVDLDYAKECGYENTFMMGLCTYGFAVRCIIQQVMPYEPERVKHISAQIRNLCFPGCDVRIQTWKAEEGTLYFKMLDDQDRVLLNNGLLEYEG